MKVILYQPQIPQNTGNIVRTCSVTNTELILVAPLGFSVQDRWLKRAGLDYWEGVQVEIIEDLEDYLSNNLGSFYCFSSKATVAYTSVSYQMDTILIFGSETAGLPDFLWERWPERFVTIPMRSGSRCFNLATSVGIGVCEGIRQLALF